MSGSRHPGPRVPGDRRGAVTNQLCLFFMFTATEECMPYHECRPLSYLAVPLPFYSPGPKTREWCARNRLGLPISVNGLCSCSSDRPQANLIQTVLTEALFTVEPRLSQVDALRRLTFQSSALCQQSSLQRTGFTVAIISTQEYESRCILMVRSLLYRLPIYWQQ